VEAENLLQEEGGRRVAPSLCSHENHAFSIEVDEQTIRKYETFEEEGKTFGVEEDTEKTYICVRSLKQVYEENVADWTTLGILSKTILVPKK
jgi:hypothetical protein